MSNGPVTLVAPHQDDVALSLSMTAACLIARGIAVRIVNCFTVSAFAPGGKRLGQTEISSLRREEDRRFAGALGLEGPVTDLGFHDAPLRCRGGIRDIFHPGEFRPDDREQLSALSTAIRGVSGAGPVILPLAIGNHVDHRLARDAGLLACGANPLAFYEDLPYAARCQPTETASVVEHVASRLRAGLSPLLVGSREHLQAKERYLAFYLSQLSDAVRRRVLDYSRAHGGERLWVTPAWTQWMVQADSALARTGLPSPSAEDVRESVSHD